MGLRMKLLGKILADNSNVNSILLSIIILFMVFAFSIGGRVSHIGRDGIEFSSDISKDYELEATYWDVFHDAESEIARSNVDIINLYCRAFSDFFGDSDRINASYRMLITGILEKETKSFTLNSVFRNHFPPIKDTIATKKHCEYVSMSGLYLTVSEIDEDWKVLFPRLSRGKFAKYLEDSKVNSACIDKKMRSLMRIELMKLTIIGAVRGTYPDMSEQEIKRFWATKH